jgi:hypothetical protein
MYLVDYIPQFLLDLLLSPLKPLPQIIAYTAPLQKCLQRRLAIPYTDDPMDIFSGPPQP